MREIHLGADQRFTTFVSEEDYLFLVQWRWQWKISVPKYSYSVYAKRTTKIAGRKITLLMSHVILLRQGLARPGDEFDAAHIDDNSLNNQRDNLQWLHRSINRGKPSIRRIASQRGAAYVSQ